MKESANHKTTLLFDFLFVGLGAANCLLILRLHYNGLLKGKTVAILEPDHKNTNDRTFCFWATEDELSKLNLQTLISYSWDYIEINGITKQLIDPLHYYHIKGIDLYTQTKSILGNHTISYFSSFLLENPRIQPNYCEIILENNILHANKVFDSRPPTFETPKKNESQLYQSFYGWTIKTSTNFFDTSAIVMMDFNVPQNDSTQFIYVLPFNQNTALVELTRFGAEKLTKEESHYILDNYIKKLDISFDILDYEQGVIPMSSAKMKVDDFGENWINMGVRAGLLKSTTGYVFHAMAEDTIIQAEAIKNNQFPQRSVRKSRFLFYDRLLLKILDEKPEYGKIIFETLFKKIPVTMVFRFLREQTTIFEEIPIFLKLPRRIFIKTAVKDFLYRFKSLPVLIVPFLFTVFTIVLSQFNYEDISSGILILGFLSVGLSHGALDHLTSHKIIQKKQLFTFIGSYLLKSTIFGLIWFFFPDIALLLFIAYSAWHFGQADFKEWKLAQGIQSFLWGLVVLCVILFFHFEELKWIIQQIPNIQSINILNKITEAQLLSFQVLILVFGLCMAVLNKSKQILFTLIYLLLSSMLPLLVSFGIYFVGQHSIHGWRHLLTGLNERSSSLWLKSLPFSTGGALIILCFPFFAGPNYVGMFFILLSCLSIPHIFSMHRYYSKLK
jgi:lycopene beta-cyclase